METKKWSKKKLLKFSVVTLVFIFILLELVGRILFYVKFRGLKTSVYTQGSPLLIEDTSSIYKNRPFYVDYQKRFQYNEEGMKSATGDFLMPTKGKNELWILLLGASAMEGMGSNKNGKWFDITNIPDHPYNETIASFLQSDLQHKYPGKKVWVFNAAVSGFTLSHTIRRYQSLSAKYAFDWVISMDGVNEPSDLPVERSMQSYNEEAWENQPFHHQPLKSIISVTQHSAFFLLAKQELFYLKQRARIAANKLNDFPERKHWLQQATTPDTGIRIEPKVTRVSNLFLQQLQQFEKLLQKDNKQYLLLVQPHLAFRSPARFTVEEKALNNYYRKEYNDTSKNTFLSIVYDSVGRWTIADVHMQTMNGVLNWPGWIFVDYCHFTTGANRRIAAELSNFIISGGTARIFQH